MKVGFVGLGNLGLPCALAIERFGGHEVLGYDCRPTAFEPLTSGRFGRFEPGVEDLLAGTQLKRRTPQDIGQQCDIVFVAVQTPHDPRYEGITPLPDERVDFDYSYLESSIAELVAASRGRSGKLLLNVVSTVLPGTIRTRIEPLLEPHCRLTYNPFFIAMGSTIQDFMHPEFVLIGSRDETAAIQLRDFYGALHARPCLLMSIEEAELTKVSYNTFIGLKLAFVNTLAEICEKIGGNVDRVTGALCQATERVVSARYMQAGMGDGGGCHPRDNIAMSWLARRLELSYDLFEAAMLARERHARWLARELIELSKRSGLPITILGKSYKADSDLTVGSPALLVQSILLEDGVTATAWDPWIDTEEAPDAPGVFLIGTAHSIFRDVHFSSGSVVVDPWGVIEQDPDIELIRLGRS